MKKMLAVAVLALIACLPARSGEIVVGTNAEFMPFEFTDDNNNIIGFDIDVINAIGRESGFTVRMQHQSFDTLISGLEVGRLDAVISGMTITEVRRQKVDFSEPYYLAAQVIVVREGVTGLDSIEAIKDKRVGVQLGTTGAIMAEEVMGEDNPDLKQFRRYNEVFMDLQLGRIDAIVIDLPVAQAYLRKMKGFAISSDPMSKEEYGIPVKKGNKELLDKINAGLAKIRASGEYDAIFEKWFAE